MNVLYLKFIITVPKWAVIRAYTPPLAPERNTAGLYTLVQSDPLKTPNRYTSITLHQPETGKFDVHKIWNKMQ